MSSGNIVLDTGCMGTLVDEARTCLQDVLWTFYKNTQSIIFYKDAQETITIEDPNYDSNWSLGPKVMSNKTYATQTTTLEGIIIYNSPQDIDRFVKGDEDLAHVRMQNIPQTIRIKFKTTITGVSDILAEIKKAKIIEFNSNEYRVDTDIKHTMFFGQPIWYEIVMMRVN